MGGSLELTIVNDIYLYLRWEKDTEKSRLALKEIKALSDDISKNQLSL
jgi:hypothetical protein